MIRLKEAFNQNHKVRYELLDRKRLPKHVAFIVDGNRRWAEKNGFPLMEGHRKGAQVVWSVMDYCLELNIPIVTFYLFSTENWKRTKKEIDFIMKLGGNFLKEKIKDIHSKGIRIKVIGRMNELKRSLQGKLHYAEELTKENKKMIVNLAINYGGRAEIVDAINRILENEGIKEMDEETFSRYLYTSPLPDPDLLIRTGGEYRISNFLLWQIAYTEIVIVPEFWPEFTKEKLYVALEEYQRRKRRWGE